MARSITYLGNKNSCIECQIILRIVPFNDKNYKVRSNDISKALLNPQKNRRKYFCVNMEPYIKFTLLNKEREVWTTNELWHLGAFIFQEHDRSACPLENRPELATYEI